MKQIRTKNGKGNLILATIYTNNASRFLPQRNKQSLEQPKLSNNGSQQNVFVTVLLYCLLIIFAPIVTFFVSKTFILDNYLESVPSNIWAAILAVIALHIALGLFLYKAYFSDSVPQSNRKQD